MSFSSFYFGPTMTNPTKNFAKINLENIKGFH